MSYEQAAEYVKSKSGISPEIAVVLGTGLDELVDSVKNSVVIPYNEIPGFPMTKKTWHKCRAVLGMVSGKSVIFMQGRLHYYEGYSMQELVFPIRMLKAMGINNIILTNSTGAINTEFVPGDIVLVNDHIKMGFDSPLRGENLEELGERFFDMTKAYDPELLALARKCAELENISLFSGVYGYMTGPQFETPAEIRMLKALGADLVGMSTVPEVIAAVHCGAKALVLSGVSNMAAGLHGGGLNKQVIKDAEFVLRDEMQRLVARIIKEID